MKRSNLILLSVSIIILFFFIFGGVEFAGQEKNDKKSMYVINDFAFYPTPKIPLPEKGKSFDDQTFHMRITRITDSVKECPGPRGYNLAYAGYPKWDIENADGTMLVIQSLNYPSYWHIYNANPPYNKIKDVPPKMTSGTKDPDVRWDNKDPYILYSTWGTQFFKWNIKSDTVSLIRDFKNDFPDVPLVRIATAEEGDASDDRRYWCFKAVCNDPSKSKWWNEAVIVYDLIADKIITRVDKRHPEFLGGGDWVGMSPSGNYFIIGSPPCNVFKRDGTFLRTLWSHGHVDFAYDATGREVLVSQKEYFKYGFKNLGYWAWMADLETGETFYLAPGLGNFHVSGNAHSKPGWAVYSVYDPLDYTKEPTMWSHRSVFMVELKRIKNPAMKNHAKIWRIAHTHTLRKGYADDPFAKVNRRGTKIWFGSAWDKSFEDTAPYDVYQIDLPKTWHEDLK